MTDAPRWKATIHVGGLSALATVQTVHDAFLPFGDIVEVSLPKNDNPKSTEPHRGFAYVEFEEATDAKEAIDNMDQAEFFGRNIRVSAARAPKNTETGLGSKTAIWEQDGYLAQHAASEEDSAAETDAQKLEGLDVAGPKPT